MALDPRIPLMAQGINLEPRSNALQRAAQMQDREQTNALRQMQMQQMQQAAQQSLMERQAAAQREQSMMGYLQSMSGQAGPPQPFNPAEAAQRLGSVDAAKKLQEMMQPKGAEGFTLPPGAQRHGPDGKLIASAPFAPKPPNLPAFADLQSYRDSLPAGDPRRREVQSLIDNQTRPPKYASAPAGPSAAPMVQEGGESQAAFTKMFGKAEPGRRWKADGSQEPIPGGSADRKTNEQTAGKETVDSVVASLRSSYDALDTGGGITSTKKGTLDNLQAATSRSALGQTVGGALGTKNQKERDSIAQARPLLLQAIMKATGMSAKQMDSNAELKLYLATATDPTLSLEANKEALDRIEQLYGSGALGKADAPPKPAGKTVKRTGTSNGRKVVEYTDGSIEYAD